MQPDFWNDKRPAGVPSEIDLAAYKSVVEVFERSCKKFADRPAFSNLGASIGTALAGAVLISALTASFFTGIKGNPAIAEPVQSKAQIELSAGIPFVSDADLQRALNDAGIHGAEADAIINTNSQARLDGLRAALSVLALFALLAECFTYSIPRRQPGAQPVIADRADEADHT